MRTTAIVLFAAMGCHATKAPPRVKQPSSPPPVVEPPPKAGDVCTLQLIRGSHDAGVGNRVDRVDIVNTGNVDCTVEGYPDVALEDANGKPLAVKFLQSETNYFGDKGTPSKIVLAPTARAHFAVAYHGTSATCPTSATLVLHVPESKPLRVAMDIQQCPGDNLQITPFLKGPAR